MTKEEYFARDWPWTHCQVCLAQKDNKQLINVAVSTAIRKGAATDADIVHGCWALIHNGHQEPASALVN